MYELMGQYSGFVHSLSRSRPEGFAAAFSRKTATGSRSFQVVAVASVMTMVVCSCVT